MEYFDEVQKYLKAENIEFTINPKIVRGLDYYTKTVFEFISNYALVNLIITNNNDEFGIKLVCVFHLCTQAALVEVIKAGKALFSHILGYFNC